MSECGLITDGMNPSRREAQPTPKNDRRSDTECSNIVKTPDIAITIETI